MVEMLMLVLCSELLSLVFLVDLDLIDLALS